MKIGVLSADDIGASGLALLSETFPGAAKTGHCSSMTKNKSKIPRSVRKKLQEQKRIKQAIQESQERLLQRVKENPIHPKQKYRINPQGMEKMSEILIEYARPLLNAASNAEEEKHAIAIAVTIWNLCLLPEEAQFKYLPEVKKVMKSSHGTDALSDEDHEIIGFLKQRKKLLFPDINRMIVAFEYLHTPKGFHLNVVSNDLEKRLDQERQ